MQDDTFNEHGIGSKHLQGISYIQGGAYTHTHKYGDIYHGYTHTYAYIHTANELFRSTAVMVACTYDE